MAGDVAEVVTEEEHAWIAFGKIMSLERYETVIGTQTTIDNYINGGNTVSLNTKAEADRDASNEDGDYIRHTFSTANTYIKEYDITDENNMYKLSGDVIDISKGIVLPIFFKLMTARSAINTAKS